MRKNNKTSNAFMARIIDELFELEPSSIAA